MYILTISFLLVLLVLSLIHYKERANALNSFIGLWLLVVVSHFLVITYNIIPLYKLNQVTLFFVSFVGFMFYCGYIISSFLLNNISKRYSLKKRTYIYIFKYDVLFFLYAIIVLVLMFNRALNIAKTSDPVFFFIALRSELNYGGETWGVIGYLSLSVIVGSIMFFARANIANQSGRYDVFLYLIAIVCCVLSTGRTNIFMMAIAFFAIRVVTKGLNYKILTFAVIVVVTLFAAFSVILNKGGSIDNSFIDNLMQVSQTFLYYLLSPITAFSEVVNYSNSINSGAYTFRFVDILIGKIDGDEQSFNLVQGNVQVPVATNVYTFMHAAYTDFGAKYLFMESLVLGGGYALLSKLSKISIFNLSVVGISYFPLIISFYQDNFLTLFSMWVQVLLFMFFISFLLCKKECKGR